MAWVSEVRQRAQDRLATARRSDAFEVDRIPVTPVQVVAAPVPEDPLPRGVRTAGAWAWRFILFIGAGYLFIQLLILLSVVVIPVVVAILLAAMLQPIAAWLSKRGMSRSVAAALVLVTGLIVVFGGLSLIVTAVVSQSGTLADQVSQGIGQVQTWLADGPLNLSQTQINDYIAQVQTALTSNREALTSGALSTATTLGHVGAGFFITLFTLFFFLRDGGDIWAFLCRMLPRDARTPTARAGHYAWHTLVSYVHATVLVAFVDALGIGIGLVIMGIPLAAPLAALVFLGAFIPVIGATLTGAVAVLVALVTQGPVSALIVLAIVIGVQQLEGHVLQPLIMGRAVSLHPLAVILVIAGGVVVAGIVGGLVAVPLLAVLNTAIRYLVRHPDGEPTPDRQAPGTESTDDDEPPVDREAADDRNAAADDHIETPPAETSLKPA